NVVAPPDLGKTTTPGRRSAAAADGEGDEAEAENHQPGDVPAQIFGQPVIHDPEPGQHLAEQPTVEAVGNARGCAPTPRPAAVIEAHVHHLDEGVDPREHAYAAQLPDEQRLDGARVSQRVEDVDGQPEEQG